MANDSQLHSHLAFRVPQFQDGDTRMADELANLEVSLKALASRREDVDLLLRSKVTLRLEVKAFEVDPKVQIAPTEAEPTATNTTTSFFKYIIAASIS